MSPNRTVTTLRDVFTGLRTFMASKVSDVIPDADVKMAFKDERAEDDPSFPAMTILLYDVRHDLERRSGGPLKVATVDEGNETASVKKVQVPVDLYLQIDTYVKKQEQHWNLVQTLTNIFSRNDAQFTTSDGVVVNIKSISTDNLGELYDNLLRVAYRIKLPLWFGDPSDAESKYLVLKHRLSMNGVIFTLNEVPE